VWENWFIVTLVTLSAGVSSSGVSRGIHHKCKHPLNPTRLYVSGWVESILSVLLWKVITWLDDICVLDCDGISDCMINIFWALAYPSVVVCSAVWVLFCDDHQLVDVSRCEEHPWSIGRWWFRCLVDLTWASTLCLLPGLWPMYYLFCTAFPGYFRPRILSCLASWCALGFPFA